MNTNPGKLANNKATFILGPSAQCLFYCKCSTTSWESVPSDLVRVSIRCSVFIACFLAVLKLPFISAETLVCPTVPPHSQTLMYHILCCELPDTCSHLNLTRMLHGILLNHEWIGLTLWINEQKCCLNMCVWSLYHSELRIIGHTNTMATLHCLEHL